MVKNCMNYARRCQACQFHANYIHQSPEPLHPSVASWLFDACGLDIVEPLPKSSGRHIFILAAIDYFSKWAEATALKEHQIPSLRIAVQEKLTEEENAHLQLEELEVVDEKRLEAQQRLECYQARLSKTFNKKVHPQFFQVGDIVLVV
ncbi:hypothetical protein M9H77_35533 [Catharanthus roseus]|uniref:Uncharacterized protein n=1 Tax=Catharanthus roseus TaxID=4058 RepID=A0ACB9ZQ10_CATRO|nr:hypothetical protein M9H77_35533 [Catharanthus roseus]